MRCRNHEYMAMRSMHTPQTPLRATDSEFRPRICTELTRLRECGEQQWRRAVPAADIDATATNGYTAEKCATDLHKHGGV